MAARKAEIHRAAPPAPTVGEAFARVAQDCAAAVSAAAEGIETGDVAGLHRLRVALRRFRAAIGLFRDMLTDPRSTAIAGELGWIAAVLGPAREFDVLAARLETEKGMPALREEIALRRAAAWDDALAALGSRRFARLSSSFESWIGEGAWRRRRSETARRLRAEPLADALAVALEQGRRRVRRKGRRLAKRDEEALHRLRIRAKKLRYAAELFGEAFPGRKAARQRAAFIASVKRLQDALGELNDIAVHRALFSEIAAGATDDRRLANAARKFSELEAARIPDCLEAASAAARAFRKCERFWPDPG
jgi:triphosphatase